MNVELPRGWALATIPDLIGPYDVFSDGDWVESEDQDPDGDVRLIQLADVGDGIYMDKSHRFLTSAKARELRCTFLEAGDLLIARMPDPLGRSCIFPGDQKHAITVVDVCVVRSGQEEFDHRWLMHFINSPKMRADIHALQSGSTRKRISRGNLGTISIPVPPRSEQARIVEKLEELLSDLDAGVAELKAAQRKLAQYRQSLLKAAVEGALTADWRATQGKPKETGAELLQRILKERRARWEQKQLAKFAEQSKAPPKDWQTKYTEPVAPDLTDLPKLPNGWAWASLGQLTEIQGGIQKQPSRAPVASPHPFLRVANVGRGQLKLDEIHEIELFEGELERLALQKGDILVVEGNGSLTEIGRCALWDGSIENAVHQNHLIRARPVLARGEFIEVWLNSMRGIQRMTALAATTSGLYTLSVGKISKIPVPLPPLSEQDVISDGIAIALAGYLEQLAATEHSLKQSAAQRKNLLKAAFSGQLVPQDPNDEPASALLARIRADRESGAPIDARKRGRKAKEKT